MTKLTIFLVLIGLLTACAQVPEYVRPELPVPPQWPESPVGAGDTPLQSMNVTQRDSWRAFFLDANLQTIIAAALEHNRDLAIAVYRVEEARAQAGIAKSAYLPELDLNAQHEARGTSTNVARSSFSTTSQRYDVGIAMPAFELDFWGRLQSLDDAARANFLATEYARNAFRLSLIRDVAQSWFSVRELSQRKGLAAQTVSGREASLKLTTRRRDVGLASDIDFQTTTGALANARVELASLARQLAAAENGLRLLVGADVPVEHGVSPSATTRSESFARPPCSAVVCEAVVSSAPTGANNGLVRSIAAGLPATVLLDRPDILAAEQKLIAANANIGAARASFLPKISLTAAAGTASSALSNLFSAGGGTWSFVPALTIPLFDAGRNQDNLDIAQARKNIAVAEYEKAIQTAFRDVASLLAARTHYVAQIEALQSSVQAQSERLRLIEARYAGGVANHLELLDARRDSFAAQQNLLSAQQQALSTSASLFAALGGN